jgi:hypothetical protein
MSSDILGHSAFPRNEGAQAQQPHVSATGGYPAETPASPAGAEAVPAGAWLYMLQAKRWLLRNAGKQPFYVDGTPRSGKLDTPEELARLVTYDEATAALAASGGRFAGLGFALGPDGAGGCWQGIDLDKISDNQLSDLANN